MQIWSAAIKISAERPIVGGPDTFHHHFGRFEESLSGTLLAFTPTRHSTNSTRAGDARGHRIIGDAWFAGGCVWSLESGVAVACQPAGLIVAITQHWVAFSLPSIRFTVIACGSLAVGLTAMSAGLRATSCGTRRLLTPQTMMSWRFLRPQFWRVAVSCSYISSPTRCGPICIPPLHRWPNTGRGVAASSGSGALPAAARSGVGTRCREELGRQGLTFSDASHHSLGGMYASRHEPAMAIIAGWPSHAELADLVDRIR
jgi:hypothetical protein